jgi:polyhydroxyalkanoate synthesis repressor PhaR
MAEKVMLKKYANRRLYDTDQKVFVSLSQVADLVKEGREIEIRDDKTGEDVTAFILTQIVLEEAKKKSLLLPVSLLSLLIRYGDSVLSEFFDKYLEQTLKNYLVYKSTMDSQFQKWLELGQDFSNLTQKAMTGLTPFPSWMELFPGATPNKAKEEGEGEQ